MKSTFHKTLALTLSVSMLAAYTPGFATVVADNVTYEDAVVADGQSALRGGAFEFRNGATFEKSATFTDNSATGEPQNNGWGGAIFTDYNATEDVVFKEDASFSGNTAHSGGAVYNESSIVFEGPATFENNKALYGDGGALVNHSNSTVLFNDTVTFTNNAAHALGGAISNAGTITFEKLATFTGNKSGNKGASISNSGTINFKDGLVANQNVDGYTGIDNSGTLKVTGGNVSITDNTANRAAGLFNNGLLEMSNVDEIVFANNTATASSAGALGVNEAGNTSLSANTITFDKNQATGDGYGGAIFTAGNLSILGAQNTFSNNTNTTTGYGSKDETYFGGGAIHARSADNDAKVIIGTTDSVNTFTNNVSNEQGGALFARNAANVTINGTTTFENNTAAKNGGAIYVRDSASTITFNGSASFTGNKASQNGGAIYNSGTLDVTNATFENNQATSVGGAMAVAGHVTIEDSTFTGNQTVAGAGGAAQGGALFQFRNENLTDEPYTLTVKNSTFESNIADIGQGGGATGGAVDIYAKADFDNVKFLNNAVKTTDTLDGGGAAHMGSWSKVTFSNSTFAGNTSQTNGGALRTRSGPWVGTGKNNNSAALLDITHSTFADNKADINGGAFYNNFYNSVTTGDSVYIEDASFENNTATEGGAIYNTGDTDILGNVAAITLKDSTFTGNTASGNGGAIYNGGTLTLAGTNTFTDNTAAVGADIYNDGTLNLNGTTTIDGGIAGTGDVNVDGTLNIGSTQVAADSIAFAANSTLGVEFGNTDMGNLQANTVTIGNGSNLVVSLSKDFLTTDTTTHDLINRDAAVTGAFTLADVGNALYNVSLNEDNKVIAQRKSQEEQSENVKEVGGTNNDVAVIAAYTSASDLGGETANKVGDIINTLAQTDTAAAVAVTKAIAPEVAPAKQVVHTAVLNEVFGAVQNRLAAATTVTPATYALGDSKNYRAANAKNFSVWTQGLLNKSHKEATNNASAFTGRSTGIAAGADMKPTDNTLVGAGYAYTHTNVSSTGRHDRILGDTFFLYGQYRPSAFYVQGSVAYGDSKYEESKYLPGLTLDADYHVQSYSAQGLVGYDVTDWLSPNFGLRYTRLHQEGYNDGAQDVSADNSDYFTGMLGADLQTQMRVTRNFSLLPHMHAGLAYDFVSADNDGRVALPNGTGYKVYGERLHRLSVELGAGFTARLYQNVEISAAYEGSFREDYNSHTGTLKLRYLF